MSEKKKAPPKRNTNTVKKTQKGANGKNTGSNVSVTVTKKSVKKAVAIAKRNKTAVIAVAVVAVLIAVVIIALYLGGYLNPLIAYINEKIEAAGGNNNNDNNNTGNNGFTPAAGDLRINFIDVGQGDAILIELPDGKTILIDGGDRLNSVRDSVLAYLGERAVNTLNYAVLTHTDADHCGSLDDALTAVENIEKVYFPKIKTSDATINSQIGLADSAVATITTNAYRDFVAAILASSYLDGDTRKATEYAFLLDEIVIDGGNYRFTMYCVNSQYYDNMSASNSKAINDVSPIAVLEYAGRKVIFTGDANKSHYPTSAEKRFMDSLGAKGFSESYDSDILKVAHHGGKDSSGADFLDFVRVEYAVISVGERSGSNSTGDYSGFVTAEYYNSGYTLTTRGNGAYDHPHREVAGIPAASGEGRLASAGVQELYRTDLHGDTVVAISEEGGISVVSAKSASVDAGVIVFVTVSVRESGVLNGQFLIYYEERLRAF